MLADRLNHPTVIVTDCDHANLDPEHDIFTAAGISWDAVDARSEEDVVTLCGNATVLLNQYAPLSAPVFSQLTKCRAVVRYGVGVDHIDLQAATDHGVLVCNVPDYAVEEVSDHALVLVLSLLRRVPLLDRNVHNDTWDAGRAGAVQPFEDCVLGVIGVGRIGAALCRKAARLGMRVLGSDLEEGGTSERIARTGAEPVSLNDLLASAHAVSLNVPLDETTYHLIGEYELRRMQRGAVLVNTARGGVVDEDALVRALDDGHLAGAGLDVLETEPILSTSRLLRFENVVLTPHAAWYSTRAYTTLKTSAAQEVVRILRGKRPRNPLNPEVYDHAKNR